MQADGLLQFIVRNDVFLPLRLSEFKIDVHTYSFNFNYLIDTLFLILILFLNDSCLAVRPSQTLRFCSCGRFVCWLLVFEGCTC